jgi:predicted enzyme related to lactoylglutathione lyase
MLDKTPGKISWVDLTIPDAEAVRTFYEAVAGWTSDPVSMGDYDDYSMLPAADAPPVAGVCHSRGPNAEMPAQWMIYINVADLEASLKACVENGGQVIVRRPPESWGAMAVIRDPAGAVCALFQHAAQTDESE